MTYGFAIMFIGDFLPLLIIGTLLMKTLSRYITNTVLYVNKIFYKTLEE
ncbi:MAG: hypothetical protein ACTSYO_06485 [Candidatus Ranarchaeia archaeon]